MIKKILAIALAVLLVSSASAISMTGFISMLKESNYVAPEKNLIIVETTGEGTPIEKRMAEDADLLFNRALKIKAIFGATGITDYENEFILSLHNVSGRDLESISLIETIPEGTAENPERLESDENFVVMETSPAIIKFSINVLRENETKKITYQIRQKQKVEESAFWEMPLPIALIKAEEQNCIGITCNSFNPCARDYCERGECKFEFLEDGTDCSENKQCQAGKCIELTQLAGQEIPPRTNTGLPKETVYFVMIAIAVAIAAFIIIKTRIKH